MASRMNATPICRCRVLYLGSAVPHITKDGLQGIQEPLRELYPEQGALGARGIDSWLSVWSNGILLENVDENHKKVTRFFPIDSLHYCAAVRYVLVPEKTPSSASQPRFLPLDSPFARSPNPHHPPLFACILRRTTGIKVLECHSFICKREMAANALVRCCFHAYADSSYAKHMEPGTQYNTLKEGEKEWRAQSGSTLTLDSSVQNFTINELSRSIDDVSEYNGDENHKIWAGNVRESDEEAVYGEYGCSTIKSARSNRPRQIMSVTPPPPPPPKEGKKKEKKRKENGKNTVRSGMIPVQQIGHHRPPPPQGAAYPMMVVPAATMPHLRRPPPPPRMHLPPPAVFLPAKKYPVTMEEPIYMPSNRPMSPISSYQPCHFPIEAYLMQHYATMNYNRKKTKKKIKNEEYDPNLYEPRHSRRPNEEKEEHFKNNEEESPYNTGIYKRKGHMNERAFSYSIRQEHRSRSYGSLANLKFAPLPTVPPEHELDVNKDEIKKEREIMQMMQDLDLSGDDIERSEVPATVYQQTRQRTSHVARR